MKSEEFVILNLVITSLLSRLWVVFRGVLVSLAALYQQLLEFLREVSQAQPMPFLTDSSLPADVAQLLTPAHAALLVQAPKHGAHPKDRKEAQKKKNRTKSAVGVESRGQKTKAKEDLGVVIERGLVANTDMKPFLLGLRNCNETPSRTDGAQRFKRLVTEAASFTDMAAHLEEMILWCKSQQRLKQKRLLNFLLMKCHKMMCLEAAGYKVQRRLPSFRQEALWASSPRGPPPRSCRSSAALSMNPRRRARFHCLRRQLRSSTKKKHRRTQRRRLELSPWGLSGDEQSAWTTLREPLRTPDRDGQDDIDDIFASVGL